MLTKQNNYYLSATRKLYLRRLISPFTDHLIQENYEALVSTQYTKKIMWMLDFEYQRKWMFTEDVCFVCCIKELFTGINTEGSSHWY